MPFIIFGKNLTSKIGVTKTITIAWFSRSMSVLLAVFAPVITYYTSSFSLGIIFVLLGAFGFYAFRGMGMIGWTPILGELTTEKDRVKYGSTVFLVFNTMYFLGILSLVILFEFWDTVGTFQLVLTLGCAIGLCAVYNISLVPESNTPRVSASVSIKEAVGFLFRHSQGRKLLLLQTVYYIGLSLTVPYSVLALKEGYDIVDYQAMLFILVQLFGAIIFFIIIKKVLINISIRKIIIGLFLLMIAASTMWFFAPDKFYWWYCGIIFFVIGAAHMGGFLSLITYFLIIIPPVKRVGSTLVITAISSLFAGAFGSVVGAGMLRLLENYIFIELDIFRVFFIIVLCVLLCGFFIIYRLENIKIPAIKIRRR
jgi:MFS family permease